MLSVRSKLGAVHGRALEICTSVPRGKNRRQWPVSPFQAYDANAEVKRMATRRLYPENDLVGLLTTVEIPAACW